MSRNHTSVAVPRPTLRPAPPPPRRKPRARPRVNLAQRVEREERRHRALTMAVVGGLTLCPVSLPLVFVGEIGVGFFALVTALSLVIPAIWGYLLAYDPKTLG